MRRFNAYLRFAAVLAIAFASQAAELESPLTPANRAWLAAHPVIRMAFSPDYQPLSFVDEQGHVQGMVADYVARLEQVLGVHFALVVPSPTQMASDDPAEKAVDAIAIFAQTPQRLRYWSFTEPYLDLPIYLIVRNAPFAPRSIEDMAGERVAVVGAFAAREMLEHDFPQLELDWVPDTRAGLQRVSVGMSGGFVSDLPVASWWMEKEGVNNLRFAGETPLHYRLSMAVRNDWPELRDILQKGLATISPTEREAIYRKWVSEPTRFDPRLQSILYIVIGIAVTIAVGLLILFFWNRTLRRKVDQQTRGQREALERIKRQNSAIASLAAHPDLGEGNINAAVQAITESAATALDVPRVSLWLLSTDRQTLECLDLFEIHGDRHSANLALHRSDYPRYFDALTSQRAIDAHDAWSDLRTSEFLECYLKPLNIRSMMDAPIRADGDIIGVVCHEQIGAARHWTVDELGFAGSLADLTALALEVSKRKQAQEALQQLNDSLEAEVAARTAELARTNAELRAEIVEREQIEATLRESELRLQLSIKAANIGVWDWNPIADTLGFSPECKSHLGYADDEMECSRQEWERRLHPDDRERTLAAMELYLAGATEEYSTEFRLLHKDGSYRWIHARGEVVAREAGKPVRVMGCHVEITPLKQAEEALRAFRWFADSAGQGMGMASWGGEVIYMNSALADLLGRPDHTSEPGSFYQFYTQSAAVILQEDVFPALQSVGQWIGELAVHGGDGSVIPTLENFFVVLDESGQPQYVADIVTDISKQKAIERELMKAKETAESADRIKSMFVASMSHELRTPLNSIIGFTDVLLQGMSGELNERQRDQLSRVYRSAKHLLALITDVIDISKIEAGYVDVYIETFQVLRILEETVQSVHHLAQQKGLEIDIDAPESLMLTSDRKRFFQSVLNLVSNAVKYTERGRVELLAWPEADSVCVSVGDSGIGIDAAGLAKIFAPFERIDSHLKLKTPGTGLGLYLTRKIVREILQGDIAVQSEVGRGSTFKLRIPAAIEKAPDTQAITD